MFTMPKHPDNLKFPEDQVAYFSDYTEKHAEKGIRLAKEFLSEHYDPKSKAYQEICDAQRILEFNFSILCKNYPFYFKVKDFN